MSVLVAVPNVFKPCHRLGPCHKKPIRPVELACSVCFATRQLHIRDGTVHRHGSRDNLCPGSHKPPLNANKRPISSAGSSDLPASGDGPPSALLKDSETQPSLMWLPAEFALIKHIPKSPQAACASNLAALLRSAVSKPECVANWIGLFNWGGAILHPPKCGGKRHNLSTTIKSCISSFKATASPRESFELGHLKSPRTSGDSRLRQAVAAKLEDGNIKAAIRLLMSDDTPAAPSVESLDKLRQKHPQASVRAADLPRPLQSQCLR